MQVPRIELMGVRMDPLKMDQAVAQLLAWTRTPGSRCRFVVTPNVDHVVLLQERKDLQAAYADASLILADGAPVVWASKLLGKPLPGRVPGSDLVPALFDEVPAYEPLKVYLLGALPGVADRAAQQIQKRWPSVQVVGTYSPPLGFEKDEAENDKILAQIADVNPDVLVVGLGAPKQELWVHANQTKIKASVALCVGATIDFLAGEKARAPMWMRKVGLEWLHRVATEPKRLAARYARDAWLFPRIVLKEWFSRGNGFRGRSVPTGLTTQR